MQQIKGARARAQLKYNIGSNCKTCCDENMDCLHTCPDRAKCTKKKCEKQCGHASDKEEKSEGQLKLEKINAVGQALAQGVQGRRGAIAQQKCPQDYHECSWKGRGKYKPCVPDLYKDLECGHNNIMTNFQTGAEAIDFSKKITDKFDPSKHLVDFESDESEDESGEWEDDD